MNVTIRSGLLGLVAGAAFGPVIGRVLTSLVDRHRSPMTDYLGFDISALSDELIADLLETFATGRCWTDLVHSQAIAAQVIDQQLTVQFHAFIRTQIGL